MTKKNDIVLDPFVGSGSSFVASLKNSRKCIGAEIDKKYINISKKRIKETLNGTIRVREMNEPVYEPETI